MNSANFSPCSTGSGTLSSVKREEFQKFQQIPRTEKIERERFGMARLGAFEWTGHIFH